VANNVKNSRQTSIVDVMISCRRSGRLIRRYAAESEEAALRTTEERRKKKDDIHRLKTCRTTAFAKFDTTL